MTNIDQMIALIKTNTEAKKLFEKAVYWEAEAIKIDYVTKPIDQVTQQDIDDFETVWANFRHYFDQLGINGAMYEELKNHSN